MYCHNCGKKIKDGAAFCPYCGAKIEIKQTETPEAVEKPTPNQPLSKKEAKKQRKADNKAAKKDKKAQKKAAKKAKKKEKWEKLTFGQKLRKFFFKLLLLIVFLIIVLSGILGTLSYRNIIKVPFIDNMLQLFEIEPDNVDEETEFSILDRKFTETKVTDVESAIKAVQEGAEKLGLSNAAQEVTFSSMNTVDGLTYYRLQQNYKGYPVYGKDFVLLVNNYGDVSGMTANCFDITIDEMNPTITQEEINSAIYKCIKNLTDVTSLEYMDIELISKDNLCIYTLEDQTAKLVYELYVDTEYGNYTFFVDSNNADIVFYSNSTFSIQQEFTYDGQRESCTFVAEAGTPQNEMYYIGKDGTKITIYIPNSEHPYDWYYGDNSTVVSWSGKDVLDSSAVDAMYNVSNVYNYYLNTFNQSSFDGAGEDIDVYIHTIGYRDYERKDIPIVDNAYFWISPNGPVISFTKRYDDNTKAEIDEYSSELDIVAHEFTHGIVAYTAGLLDTKSNLMPGAINEAVADIMGYCAEAKIMERKIDWTFSGVRTSIKDNDTSSIYIYHTDDYKDGNKECHKASTIVSYAAYLMNSASTGSLDDDETAKLWYHTILTLPSNCTFKVLRQHVELVAKNLGFSDQQRKCIANAFDAVGITLDNQIDDDNKYNPDITLKVYDCNSKAYDNYTISINGKYSTGWFGWSCFGLLEKDYRKQFSVDSVEEQHINLNANGEYTITVSDNGESGETYEKKVVVKKKYENSVMSFATDFGDKQYSLKKEGQFEDPENMSVHDQYILAYENMTKSGSWSEKLSATVPMTVSGDGQSEQGTMKMQSNTNVKGWKEDDLSNLYLEGDGNISLDGSTAYAWTMNYKNGKLKYQYTAPYAMSAEKEMDPSLFNFGELPEKTMHNAQVKDDQITFTVPGGYMAEVGLNATQMLSELDDLDYGDATVTAAINKSDWTLKNVHMKFSATMTYMDYPVSADFDITYEFGPAGEFHETDTEEDSQESGSVNPTGHQYEVYENDSVTTWEEAKAFCENLGGHLAIISSQEENDYVYNLMKESGYDSAYFGLTDKEEEGKWIYVDGTPAEYVNWNSEEPSNSYDGENYAMFYYKYTDGTWNDGDFDVETQNGGHAFICEWEKM